MNHEAPDLSRAGTSTSFLLLKPDALRRGLEGSVLEAARRRGLQVTLTREVRVRSDDLAVLWPQFQPRSHALTLRMFERYLTSGPSLAIVVRGEGALAHARAVKQEIRTRFGNHLLGSVVHTADTAEEADRQLALLLNGRGADASEFLPAPSAVEPLPGAALGDLHLGPSRVRVECDLVYDEFMAGRMRLDFQAPCHVEGADGMVLLHRDDANTVDSYVAALLALLPGLTLRTALHIYLQVDVTNAAPILECHSPDWPRMRERLHVAGLPNVSLWPIVHRCEPSWIGVPMGTEGVPL